MAHVKPHNYYTIQGFMVTDLHLKGAELNLFALIYGFSQDGESEFTGSLSYLMEWTGNTKPTVIKALNGLVEKDLIIKIPQEIKGTSCNRYKVNYAALGSKETLLGGSKEILPGVVKNLYQGSKEILPNNYINNNIDNNINNISCQQGKIPYEEIMVLFNEICTNLPSIKMLNDKRKKNINARWNDEAQGDIENFRKVFEAANNNPFMCGKNNSGWKANIDYCISAKGFIQLLEGSAVGTSTTTETSTSGKNIFDMIKGRIGELNNGSGNV